MEAGRRAVVARGEVGCVDGLASGVGEAAEENGLALSLAVVWEGVNAENEEEDEDDILHGARAGAESPVTSRGHEGPGEEGVAVKAHKCKGAGRTRASIGDVGHAQGGEGALVRGQCVKELLE